MATVETKRILIGSACVTVSQLLFGLQEAVFVVSEFTLAQFVLSRYIIQLLFAIIWWNIKPPTNGKIRNWYGDPPYILNIWIRGILHATVICATQWAVTKLPIGDTQAVMYQAPLLAVYFGWLLLKEQLPDWYILIPSTMLSFIGCIFVSQPTFLVNMVSMNDSYAYSPLDVSGVVASVWVVFAWVASVLLVRIAIDSHFLQLEFASSCGGMFVLYPLMLIVNQSFIHDERIGTFEFNDERQWKFDLHSIAIMIYFGVSGFTAISLSVIGYQYGSATMVSWLEYINIPVGFLYQTWLFNDTPNTLEMVGGTMVGFACLLPTIQQLWIYVYSTRGRSVRFMPISMESDADLSNQHSEFTEEVESKLYVL